MASKKAKASTFKTPATKGKVAINKSAFVRGFGMDVPASDIVAKAAARGFKLSAKHVYVIRSLDKKRALKLNGGKTVVSVPVAKRAGDGDALRTARASRDNDQSERDFRTLVAHMGLDRATTVLAGIAASL